MNVLLNRTGGSTFSVSINIIKINGNPHKSERFSDAAATFEPVKMTCTRQNNRKIAASLGSAFVIASGEFSIELIVSILKIE